MKIWKDIKEYEGLYKVNYYGDIKSLPRNGTIKKEKILINIINKHGYYHVCLSKNNKHKNFRNHTLVANAFIENNKNKPCINHKDGNKLNNHISNLEWCTIKENNIHAFKTGLKNNNWANKKVIKINYLTNKIINIFNSIKEASEFENINYQTMASRISNKTIKENKFMWCLQICL